MISLDQNEALNKITKLDVVQLVERLTVNQKVAGSSPAVETHDI
jgi:hypothetical protein